MDGNVTLFKNDKSGRYVSSKMIDASFVRNFAIYNKNGNLIGHANVITNIIPDEDGNPEKALNTLLDVCIYEESERRAGAASELIDIITNLYEKVVTGESTKAGRNLCYKFGFHDAGGLFKNSPKYLLYEKKSSNNGDGEKGEQKSK